MELAREVPFGSIYILNNTFFDYETQESVKGSEEGAMQGYTVPYNSSGSFYPTLKLRLNSSFPELEITRHIKLKHQVFGGDNPVFSLDLREVDLPLEGGS